MKVCCETLSFDMAGGPSLLQVLDTPEAARFLSSGYCVRVKLITLFTLIFSDTLGLTCKFDVDSVVDQFIAKSKNSSLNLVVSH